MSSLIEKAIQKTIVYSDIFNYPLTKEEIGKWLIGIKTKHMKFRMNNYEFMEEKDGLYFLKRRGINIAFRKKREKYSKQKLKIVQKIAGFIKLIPTVKLVGVTGALAMDNAKEDDDIDLFIVTSKGLLWTTRFLVTLLIEFTRQRRHPNDKKVNNKICLNMFVDEIHLEIPFKEQDLFSAHEVLQMRLLWDRDNTYQKFIAANQWVQKFLPNAYNIKNQKSCLAARQAKIKNIHSASSGQADKKSNISVSFLILICNFAFCILHFAFVEDLLREFQLWYMRNRQTTEIVKDGVIRFHPRDARKWVMEKYHKKLALL